MLIDDYLPQPDFSETHRIEFVAQPGTVYAALWTTDFGTSLIIRSLLTLRSLPALILHPARVRRERKIRLATIIGSNFGLLGEDAGHEVLLGVTGRFWRPVGNLLPFNAADFRGDVPEGVARAVWNFTVAEMGAGRTLLATETRIICGDRSSRRKFRAYWFFVRPFSGLIRRLMLKAVVRACEQSAK